jgi:hypothetical protein
VLSPGSRTSAQTTGAEVSESVGVTLYVNGPDVKASDSNQGTRDAPLRTIAAATAIAMRNRARNIATRVVVSAGVYRESVSLGSTRSREPAPIIFDSVGNGKVIISGANIWQGWQRSGASVWKHSWPYSWGLAPIPAGWESQRITPIVRRREMIIVNGRSLEQVLSRAEMERSSATFYVDDDAHIAYVHPPVGLGLDAATVEVAERNSLLRLQGVENVVLHGLAFEYSNGPMQEAAVSIENSANVTIDDCLMVRNNWLGLSVRATNRLTIKNSKANFNGGAGMTLWRVDNLLLIDSETSHNNWRGAEGGFIGWAPAGIKSLQVTNATYRGLIAVANQTRGVWFDTDCYNVLLDHAFICGNQTDGIFIEANPGPISLSNSIVCDNRDGAGVLSGNSSGVSLNNDILYNNGKSQIMISGLYDAPRPVKRWKTGQTAMIISDHWTFRRDVVVGSGGQPVIATTLAPQLWKSFIETLITRENVWFNPAQGEAFRMAGGERLNFAGWQRTTHDENSTFEDPHFADAANYDFRPDGGSRMSGRSLPFAPPGIAERFRTASE